MKIKSNISVLVFLLVGCTKVSVPIEEMTETKISAAGGVASSAARELTLTFAPNTLSAETTVKIRTDRRAAFEKQIGPTFELTSEPVLEHFGAPVVIAIKHDTAELDVALTDFGRATPLEGQTYDRQTKTARAAIEHLSRYGLRVVSSTSTNNPVNPPSSPLNPANCPEDTPAEGTSCSDPNLSCDFGVQCCCNNCTPDVTCTCLNGAWDCEAEPSCPIQVCQDGGVAASCPSERPFGSCSERMRCPIGTECCCGECYVSTYCTCDGTEWFCAPTHECQLAEIRCPGVDAGVPDVGAPPRTCFDVEQDYYQTVTNATPCMKDADCHVIPGDCDRGLGACFYAVNATVAESQLDALTDEFVALGCMEPTCECPKTATAFCNVNVCWANF